MNATLPLHASPSDATPTPFAWAVVGPGRIAGRFVEAVHGLPGATVAAVWGRDPTRAAQFVERSTGPGTAAPRLHRQLEDLLADPTIDAVYIASPHDSHGALAQACVRAGKAVLCEKPLTPTLAQTQGLLSLAAQQRVFVMEALWTVMLPLYDQIRTWLRDGAIGDLRVMRSTFCFAAPYDPTSRLFDPHRAGGTLLDIGIYNLAITRFVLAAALGRCPEPSSTSAQGVLAATGVDQRVQATLQFAGDVVSRFECAFDRDADNRFHIEGSSGEIVIEAPFWGATQARLLRPGQAPRGFRAPWRTNGFEYEIEEAQRCIRAGLLESPAMPHAETLALVRWMDDLRRRVGVRYSFEAA